QCPDGDAARPFGLPRLVLVGPGGSGDVEVGPRLAAGELLEEHRRRARARGAAAGIGHVRDLAAELLGVLLVERHRPAAVAGALRGPADDVDPRLGLAEDPRRRLPE